MPQKILVLENDRDFRQLLGQVVNGMGYESHIYARATEAWKKLQRDPMALILLDIRMPVVHGDTFLQYIRGHGCQTPVIVVSGYLTPKVFEQLKRHGVHKVIAKPFKVARLAAEIHEVIGDPDG